MKIVLETERLYLRTTGEDVLEPMVALWTDPAVTAHIGGPRDPEKVRAGGREDIGVDAPFMLWPLILKSTGQPIGHCGLLEKQFDGVPEIELIYVLAARHWGQGYAREISAALIGHAREPLGLKRLVALISPDNGASIRTALSLGFALDREFVREDGSTKLLYALDL
ncbi:MAG: GNAT family N-acetyltransferase [Hyphomicrobiaceae bacterium]|nr:GNAT family N-acetyltransferase [Hyphomicrobiaceae bacterium]